MRWIAIALLLFGLLACKKSGSGRPGSEWQATTEKLMIVAFCQPQQYFRQCFDIDEALCLSTATETIKQCFTKVDIPATVDQDKGRALGTQVGECAGGAFEKAMLAKRKGGGKCDDPSAWTGGK